LEKLQVNLSLAKECLHIFQTSSLDSILAVEQEIVTGHNLEGASVPVKDLVSKLARLLSTTDMSQENKMRLVLLFFATKLRTQQEYDKIVESANLSQGEKDILEEFMKLKTSNSREVQSRKPLRTEYDYNLSRYFPAVKDILAELFLGELSDTQFPFLKPEEKPLVSYKPQKKRKQRNTQDNNKFREPKKQGRGMPVFIFILGGMCYSEIRTSYESGDINNTDVYIGSTSILTPEIFLSNIRSTIQYE